MRRLLLLSLLFIPATTFAHDTGPSFEAQVGQYLVDIGYSHLAAHEPITFDIDLYRGNPPTQYVDFATVDVRVTENGKEIAQASVQNETTNVPTFTVTFPEAAGYDMDVRYLTATGALIVPHTFHVDVPATAQPQAMMDDDSSLDWLHYTFAAGLFALSAGIAVYSLWERFKPKKK